MADTVLAQHPPAVKVGGRRLSVSKPKPRPSGPATVDNQVPEPASDDVDYPRPAPPQDVMHNEEHEVPKKEKRQGHRNHDNEKKLRDGALRKEEANRPTKDVLGGRGGFGAAGRVVQPAGKGFAV